MTETDLPLLSSADVASFVARGFLRFDAAVPKSINDQFMKEAGRVRELKSGEKLWKAYGEALAKNRIPEVPAGTPLAEAYGPKSALGRLLALPLVRGALRSLLGADPIFDHHFLHVTFPPRFHEASDHENVSQHTHQDFDDRPSSLV